MIKCISIWAHPQMNAEKYMQDREREGEGEMAAELQNPGISIKIMPNHILQICSGMHAAFSDS